MAQRKNTRDRIRWSHGTEQDPNESIAESKTPEVNLSGGVYRASSPTYTNGDNAVMHFDVNGNLKSTAEITDGTETLLVTAGGSAQVEEQSPLDQQVLEETLLSAVTATGASSDVYVLDKKELTICVVATAVTSGGTFTFQATPDETNYGTVGSANNVGTVSATQEITSNGTYFFEILNASSIKYFRCSLTSRTDGTFSCYLTGRA